MDKTAIYFAASKLDFKLHEERAPENKKFWEKNLKMFNASERECVASPRDSY